MPELDLGPAIEAAAKAVYVERPRSSWDAASEIAREPYLASAKAAIEAALPSLREAIAAEILAAEPPTNPNPRYRETYVLTYQQAAALVRGGGDGTD